MENGNIRNHIIKEGTVEDRKDMRIKVRKDGSKERRAQGRKVVTRKIIKRTEIEKETRSRMTSRKERKDTMNLLEERMMT